MARKSSPGSMIHCQNCGEDYSATYKRCPFCGEKPGRESANPVSSAEENTDQEKNDDDYIFDGSDVFEEEEPEPAQDYSKGGKHLAQGSSGPINWARVITFICALIIIAAALVIIFAYIFPRIHNPSDDTEPEVSGNLTESEVSELAEEPEPGSTLVSEEPEISQNSGTETGEPDNLTEENEESAASAAPAAGTATALSLNNVDFTLMAGESYQIIAAVSPSDWDGTVTWSSSNSSIATVSSDGTVTNVNTGSGILSVTITAQADGLTASATVYCRGGSSAETSSGGSESASSTELSLNRTDFTLSIGETFSMTASGADSVSWSSSNSDVATVSSSGLVTAVGSGTATITAASPDGQTATCIVRVKS